MNCVTLACGPYFDPAAILVTMAFFLAVKPLAYFAFIQAFRYRVSRDIPIPFAEAAKLAVLRTLLGIALFAVVAAIVAGASGPHTEIIGWVGLYTERLFSWFVVGRYGAGLQGRRLIGWTISGTLLNAATDFAVLLSFGLGDVTLNRAGIPLEPITLAAGLMLTAATFILLLHIIGRRDALKRRFMTGFYCRACGYDLRGNLSGYCPECGVAFR